MTRQTRHFGPCLFISSLAIAFTMYVTSRVWLICRVQGGIFCGGDFLTGCGVFFHLGVKWSVGWLQGAGCFVFGVRLCGCFVCRTSHPADTPAPCTFISYGQKKRNTPQPAKNRSAFCNRSLGTLQKITHTLYPAPRNWAQPVIICFYKTYSLNSMYKEKYITSITWC